MKKRLASILLALVMIFSLLPAAAFAAGSDYEIDVVATRFGTVQYNGKDTMKLDLMLQTNNGAQVRGIQTALVYVDLNTYDILQYVGGNVYNRTATVSTGNTVLKDYSYSTYYDPVNDIGVTAKNAFKSSGSELLMTFEADFAANDVSVPQLTSTMSVLLGLKEGADWDQLPSDSLRLATASEAKGFNATGVVTIGGTNGDAFVYLPANGSSDTLTTSPELAPDNSFTFVKAALTGTPTISGTVKVGETLTAGVAQLSDTTNITYQWCAGGADITGATSATYVLTANEAGKTITVKVTATNASEYAGTVTSAATAAVANAAQVAPTLQNSDITATTDTTITVTANADWEYSKDGGNIWQSSNVFTGLSPNTTYSQICVRLKAKTGYDASPASNIISGQTTKSQIADSAKGTLAGYSGTYNGAAQNAIVGQPADGYTATYSTTSADSGFSATMPKVTNVADSKTVWVKLSKAGFEDKVFSFTATVSAKDISGATINLGTQNTYSGSAQDVVITSVMDGNAALTNSDYDITSGGSVTDVGDNALVITGKGNYTGTASAQWTLRKATPMKSDFNVVAPSPVTYGNAVSVTVPTTTKNGMGAVTVKYDGEDAVPSYVGDYLVTFNVAEGSNYKATVLQIGTLKINPATQTITATDKTIIKNGVGVDISNWASSNAAGANLVYTLDGNPTGITLVGNILTAANADSTAGSFTVKVNSAAVNVGGNVKPEYSDAAEETITVNVTAKADADVNITAAPTSKTYGDANFELAATKAGAATGGIWAWTSSDPTILEIVSGADTATATIAVKKADTTGATITVSYTSDTHYDDASAVIKVNPKTLTKADLEYTGAAITKVYDGNTTCNVTSVSVKNGVLVGEDVLPINGTAVYNSADVAAANKVTFTPDAITTGNYALASSETLEIPAAITKANLTVEGTASASAVYGTKLKDIAISGLTVKFGASPVSGTWAFSGETVLDVGSTANQTATFTPATGAGNYNTLTKEIVPVITKATYGNQTANGSAKYGVAGTVDLTSLIVEGGTADYQSHTNTNNALEGTPSVSGKTLNFKFVDNAALATKTENIVVKVTSNNYADYTITVTVTVESKTTPTVTAPTAKAGLVYNGTAQALINAGSTTGGQLQYSLTSGSDYSTELPKATNAGSYTVYYKVVGDADYADVAENSFAVTIGKKAVTVAPKSASITKGSAIPTFELAYTGLVGSDALTPNTAATFTCFEADGTTAVSTSTAAGTYTITWANKDSVTFTGAENYDVTKNATGTLTISNSSYGGGYVSTYAITVENAENGMVSASQKSASKGSTVTVTVTPDKGYALETLTVTDKNGKEIELTNKGDGKYTFKMPSSKVTVKATFMDDNTMLNFFVDVPADAYYYDAVLWAVEEGITSGTSATTFSPDASCTRGQMATFLWRAAGSPEPVSKTSPFVDVAADAYYAKAVQWAYEKGITGGTSATTFSPDASCTRGQMATFLSRVADGEPVSDSVMFNDVKSDAYYAKAVQWAYEQKITAGTSATTFSPDDPCTRAQMVTFLYRFFVK